MLETRALGGSRNQLAFTRFKCLALLGKIGHSKTLSQGTAEHPGIVRPQRPLNPKS